MRVDISSSFKRNSKVIKVLETGHVYTDERGEDYIFLGYGGYNRLIYDSLKNYSAYDRFPADENWVVWEANGDAPYNKVKKVKPIYMYIKVEKVLNLLKRIPDTYNELFEGILSKGYFSTEVYASINPRMFFEERGEVLHGIDQINDIFIQLEDMRGYSFKFIEKLR